MGHGLDDSVSNRSKEVGAKKKEEEKSAHGIVVFCLVSLFSL